MNGPAYIDKCLRGAQHKFHIILQSKRKIPLAGGVKGTGGVGYGARGTGIL